MSDDKPARTYPVWLTAEQWAELSALLAVTATNEGLLTRGNWRFLQRSIVCQLAEYQSEESETDHD